MTVVWTRLALADLEHAREYIAQASPASAAAVVGRIEKAVAALARHPRIGRPGRLPETRELVVPGTPFILPYRLGSGQVEILALIHGARRWPDSL